MSWLTRRGWLLWAPAAVLSLVLVGCSGDKKPKNNETEAAETDDNGDGEVAGEMKAVKADGTGTITGKVTLAQGFTPPVEELQKRFEEEVNKANDKAHCLSDKAPPEAKVQQTWVLGKDGGVGNVVVFVKPEKRNEFFEVPQELIDKAKGETVKLDQPFCAFEPHVTLLFPKYRDAKGKLVNTGQVFQVTNSAPIKHNSTVGANTRGASTKNVLLNTGGETTVPAIPVYTAPITIACDIHKWMNAYAWALEHPYAAVTDKDGNFKIESVPAGVKVRIVAWHEADGFLNDRDGEVIEVEKDGTVEKNFEVKK